MNAAVMEAPAAVDFRAKFNEVLMSRKKAKDFIDLYDKLTDSVIFVGAQKPVCFGMLLGETAQRLKASDVSAVLAAIRRNEAFALAREALTEDDADEVAAKLVRQVLTVTPMDRDSLVQAMTGLVKAGVAVDRGQVLGYANLARMPEAPLDEIADLTDGALVH